MTNESQGNSPDPSEESTSEANSTSPPPLSSVSGEANDEASEVEVVDPLAQAQADAALMKDKLMRMAADFDNFRKRSRREVSDAEKKGRDSLLHDLLPVFDNLERATSHANSTLGEGGGQGAADDASLRGLLDGISLVTKQFHDALARLGIERIESVGQPFDPSLHEAIQHLETNDFAPGCIAAEVQPGYRQGERLVRPAMVVVAKAPPATSTSDSEGS